MLDDRAEPAERERDSETKSGRERERECQSICVLPALPLNLITV